MAITLGSAEYVYEEFADWARLPEGWTLGDVVDVAVDSQDRVYVFSRSEHPVIVLESDGSYVTSWGAGLFARAHGMTLAPDETLYCVDDHNHCVYQCTLDGQVLMTIGTPGDPAPALSGRPFNRPTKVAVDPKTGELYISGLYPFTGQE